MRRKHLRIWQMAGSVGRAYAVRRASARTLRTDRRARYVGACWASVRARRDGQTGAVRRVDGRADRRWSEGHGVCGVGGRVGNGQATCGHDGRQACGRSGDSDGLGGYGRLAAGGASAGAFGRRARSSGRGRGGCAKIAVPWYPMRSVARNFFAKGGLCRAGIVAVCVFPSKKYARPADGRPVAPCRAENACRRAAKKKYTPAPQGVSQEHGAGNAV